MLPKAPASGNSGLHSQFSPDPARVRDNQRRSRARRKQYLQELESKLQKCERLGVQASADVQQAARAVSVENTKLREENTRLMREIQRLEEMLRKREEDAIARASYVKNTPIGSIVVETGSSIGLADNRSYVATQCGVGEHGRSRNNSSMSQTTNATPTPTAPPSSYNSGRPQFEARDSNLGRNSACNQWPTSWQESPQTPVPKISEELGLGDDTSSCEYAAHIITSMRADVSTEDVRADLGCGNNIQEWRKCKVNNSKLFVAMDRYTG